MLFQMYGEEFDFEDPAVTEVKILTKTVLDFSSPTGGGSEVESFGFLRKVPKLSTSDPPPEVESFGFLRKVPYLKNKYLKAEEAIKKMKKETVGKRSAHYQVILTTVTLSMSCNILLSTKVCHFSQLP